MSLSASVRMDSPLPLVMPENERERGRTVPAAGTKFARGIGWFCAATPASTWSICAVTPGEPAFLLPAGDLRMTGGNEDHKVDVPPLLVKRTGRCLSKEKTCLRT